MDLIETYKVEPRAVANASLGREVNDYIWLKGVNRCIEQRLIFKHTLGSGEDRALT